MILIDWTAMSIATIVLLFAVLLLMLELARLRRKVDQAWEERHGTLQRCSATVQRAEGTFAENLGLKREIKHMEDKVRLLEGKETTSAKLIDNLIDDKCDIVAIRNLWSVLETIKIRTPEAIRGKERDELIESKIMDDIRHILFERRKVQEVTDDDEGLIFDD